MFWNKPQLPVTSNDQEWTEDSLLWVKEQFGEDFLRTVSIKTPTTKYFNRKFKGTEEDATFAFERICEYMSVDPKTIYLSFYGHEDIASNHRLPHNVQSNKTPAGLYTEWPEGYQEISLNLKDLNDPISIISTLAHEIAHVKLLGEKRISVNNEPLTDLLAVAFGFGIFHGNSVFLMKQWMDKGAGMHGWSMKRKGYLPEQVIAYAMAWMASYQGDEECIWSKHLNKTMSGFFESSRAYIKKYPEKIRFEIGLADHALSLTRSASSDQKPPQPISYEKAKFPEDVRVETGPLPDMNGKWSGVLLYGKMYRERENAELYFSIDLITTEEDEFEGTSNDLKGVGMNPDSAVVKGFVDENRISFVLQYKSMHRMNKDGGVDVDNDKPGPEIFYTGNFNHSRQEYEGDWAIERNSKSGGSGTWRMAKGETI